MMRLALILAALALSACAVERSPAGSAQPHGATSVAYDCPEPGPQRRCRVPQ